MAAAKHCVNIGCAMKGQKVTSEATTCIGCGRALEVASGLGGLFDSLFGAPSLVDMLQARCDEYKRGIRIYPEDIEEIVKVIANTHAHDRAMLIKKDGRIKALDPRKLRIK